MASKTKLLVISASNFMADFIFDEFKNDEEVKYIHFNMKKNALTAILKYLRIKLGNKKGMFNRLLFDKRFLDTVKEIGPDCKVLLWSIENYKDTLIIAKETGAREKLSFLWNPMLRLRHDRGLARKYMPDMNRNNIEISTFDRDDSMLLPCRLMPQVHRRIALPEPETPPRGVFFVGQLKGRENILSELETYFAENGIPVNFHLIRGSHYNGTIPVNLSGYMKNSLMSYDDTLANINKSECLLEIVQPGQKGLTLRAIEALFYHKKLITNNSSIKEEPFYNENNIFIIGGQENSRTIKEFIHDIPYSPVDKNIEERYHIRNWLKELLSSGSNQTPIFS